MSIGAGMVLLSTSLPWGLAKLPLKAVGNSTVVCVIPRGSNTFDRMTSS